MTRYVGIDYGTKRIGLAVGDSQTRLASPLDTVAAAGDLDAQARRVADRAEPFAPDAFVLGLPRNMDDTEGPQAKRTRSFGEHLARATDKPVHYFDERLSTFAAEELLAGAELTRKKKKARLDRVAAQVMLQGFLDAQ